ncbi:cupin domain-containing protein [Massilia terrae]|uniref:Cupin domain-containing protein n=1 Tax=Massilia terrae TaxID=1811224 RepID=A0ABT2D261_9BURK|nr:cupin domain-containing protein [Massilia terrae]MCS0660316.1 cupin domain-containing protein [Massilia terrae]
MSKLELNTVPERRGTNYPVQFSGPMQGRIRQALGDAAGLTQFGVNLLRLPPGAWSAQRHWHSHEDEFVYIVSGEVVMITDEGEQTLRAGDCAGFPAGAPNGHHLVNRSNAPAVCLEVGTRNPERDAVDYPDIDMICEPGRNGYSHRDGTPY